MIVHIYQSLLLLFLKYIYISTEMSKAKAVGAAKMRRNFPASRNTCVKTESVVIRGMKNETRKKGSTQLFVNTINGDKKRILKKVKKECGRGGIKQERMVVCVHPPNGSDTKNIKVKNLPSGSPFFVIKNFELKWRRINVTKNELQLKYCFLIGQEFCFSEVCRDTYIGLVNKKIYLFKETEEGIFYQCVYDPRGGRGDGTEGEDAPQERQSGNPDSGKTNDLYEQDVNDFFNLQFPLSKNIEMWKKKDKRMKEITDRISGLRILKADSVESFFSFLCSTNNNIPRITLMIDCLRRRYGRFLATVMFDGKNVLVKLREDGDAGGMALDKNKKHVRVKMGEAQSVRVKGEPPQNCDTEEEQQSVSPPKKEPQLRVLVKEEYPQKEDDEDATCGENRIFYENLKTLIKEEREMKVFPFYEFPSVEVLSKLKEEDLRNLGFGYRSSYVIESAKMLVKRGSEQWIEDLKKEKSTKSCIDQLILFPGIGLKVANCICLFGLNKFDCIPIDTHIYDIIYKYYQNIVESECAPVPRRSAADKGANVGNVTDVPAATPIKGKKKGQTTTRQATPTSVDRMIKQESEKDTKANPKPHSKQQKKALTTSLYIRLYTRLKDLLGPNCGWAQTILFASELKKFSHLFE
ncbi:N-glycosylase/DNA lyase [Plasmodium coatneyi]|uniref:DNA-(apurinic or apyrimidinic site) lyase n=1 Tax=Plasmodium coatneyi TaxID=208452 RepID=A0A1B1DWZ2_9APIC|nr:N-glycosylase/DNA lyase [Plasmodium coatneyi]ANQ07278.1 N-glycosylase/DNA lyase [Plasmodium coatneyi]